MNRSATEATGLSKFIKWWTRSYIIIIYAQLLVMIIFIAYFEICWKFKFSEYMNINTLITRLISISSLQSQVKYYLTNDGKIELNWSREGLKKSRNITALGKGSKRYREPDLV